MAFEFEYQVSLSIVHASVDPKVVSKAITELQPQIETKAGKLRRDKHGKPFVPERTASLSHWLAELHKQESLSSDSNDISEFLIRVLTPLRKHRGLFAQLRQDGHVRILVGWFSRATNSAGILCAEVLQLFGELGVDLELDVYSPDR